MTLELFQRNGQPSEAIAKGRLAHDVDADSSEVIRTLRQFAAAGKRWVLGKELCESIWGSDHENHRRRLRAVAEDNGKLILSGDKGYCLMMFALQDEIEHAANRIESQAKRMLARAIAIRNAYHDFGHN